MASRFGSDLFQGKAEQIVDFLAEHADVITEALANGITEADSTEITAETVASAVTSVEGAIDGIVNRSPK